MSKLEKLEKIYLQYKKMFSHEDIVCGDGSPNSKILLIGEAPGKDEVIQKKPFVGAAGKKLKEFLDILEISREDIFITNVIKYRLGKISEKTGNLVNRPSKIDDIEGSRRYLVDEINTINPQILITLGNVPLRAVFGDYNMSIGDYHGKVSNCLIDGVTRNVFALYHPASLIYNRSLQSVYNEDVLKLKEHLKKI